MNRFTNDFVFGIKVFIISYTCVLYVFQISVIFRGSMVVNIIFQLLFLL